MTKPTLIFTSDSAPLTKFNSSANTIMSETPNNDANLFHFEIPISNRRVDEGILSSSENVSLMPKKTTIILTGTYRGEETELKDFVMEIEAETNSFFQKQKTYANSFNRHYGVKFNNFTYVTSPNTNKLDYTLELWFESLPTELDV